MMQDLLAPETHNVCNRLQRTVKDVQGGVVHGRMRGVGEIPQEVLQLHAYRVAVVIAAHLPAEKQRLLAADVRFAKGTFAYPHWPKPGRSQVGELLRELLRMSHINSIAIVQEMGHSTGTCAASTLKGEPHTLKRCSPKRARSAEGDQALPAAQASVSPVMTTGMRGRSYRSTNCSRVSSC
jgi:hypothetical protein